MLQKLSKLLVFFLFFLTIFPTITIAQVTSDWISIILQTLLGELPAPCEIELGSPECIRCLGYVKFLPLVFFTTLFFFVFYLVIQQTLPPVVQPGLPPTPKFEPIHYRIATIIGLSIAIILLHVTTIEGLLNQLILWLGLFTFILALILSRAIMRVTVAALILEIIILVVVLSVLWVYIVGMISPVIKGWQEMCIA